MARIRTIKPEFFLHEELAELSALHRLLFIGLWTLVDREGRVEDRPKRIKAALLPWEECDIDALLTDLAKAGFIQRYSADGVDCIAIPSFEKHQRPHPKEPSTGLPIPPVRASRGKKRQEIKDPDPIPSSPVGREGKESLDNGKGREGKEISGKPAELFEVPPKPVKAKPAPADLQELWNEIMPHDLPRWQEMPKSRESSAKERLKERPLLDDWRLILTRIAASGFCCGQNDRGWKADPDFLLRPGTGAKVLEGKYDDRAPPKAKQDPTKGFVRASDNFDPSEFEALNARDSA